MYPHPHGEAQALVRVFDAAVLPRALMLDLQPSFVMLRCYSLGIGIVHCCHHTLWQAVCCLPLPAEVLTPSACARSDFAVTSLTHMIKHQACYLEDLLTQCTQNQASKRLAYEASLCRQARIPMDVAQGWVSSPAIALHCLWQ